MMCAKCGKEIGNGEYYIEVLDNYLQAHYFDTREDAIFCCQDCLCKAISAKTMTNKEEVYLT